MIALEDRIIDLLKKQNLILQCGNNRLIWEGDRWQVFTGTYWDYCLYSGFSLDDAIDELTRK